MSKGAELRKGYMSPRSPTVQAAMAAVRRRIRAPRATSQLSEKTTASTPHTSLFVSSILSDLHTELTSSSSSSSASQGFSKNTADLSCTLRSLLQMNRASASPAAITHDMKRTGPSLGKNNKVSENRVEDALPLYNPTIDPTILKRVAVVVDIDGAIKRAREFVRAIRDGGNFCSILSGLRELQSRPTMQELELQAGIAARLHHGRNGERVPRLRGFRMYTSDVQVAEVLPSGKIVTFISPTLPDAIDTCHYKSTGPEQRYLHFVLYKEGLSLSKAFRLLSEACEGMCLPEHFAANVALEESAVTVQVCSLRFLLPDSTSYETHQATVIKKLLRVNLRPLQMNIQLLGWRSFPCDPVNSSRCHMQYSMLLRGITTPTTTGQTQLEKRVLGWLAVFPNFFGPCHFGMRSPSSPFRSYHAAAAWEKNMPAEALLIAACLSDDARTMAGDGWVSEMVRLLQSGENRPAVLKEWYHLHVSCGLRAQIERSKSALLWNVLASCRIHELGGGAVEGSPEAGEFVLHTSDGILPANVVTKPELFPDASLLSLTCGDDGLKGVHAVLTREEAAPYTLRDVVIPLNVEGNEVINHVSRLLGFTPASHGHNRLSCHPAYFRPLFSAGSGHPRTTRPWVKALPELSEVIGENGDGVYKLLTDMELRQRTSYTATSRGQPRSLWPIGKYGFRLAERLPAGAVALAASDTARQGGTKSLALHFTLPAHTYSMAFFREFMTIEEHTTLSHTPGGNHRSVERTGHVDAKEKNDVVVGVTPSDGEVVDGDILGKMRRNRV
ncbi:hypothetical protein MOQ_008640 [Trypanosoma cruzi marinkellei]|uniref:Uncharacterized protein n=1 Tax=Trypanosoma cruzi marinkellei TaxID=85056 RepID=K2LYD6_TRYCR|nr:hypothetical protein MOQ_008640 [Trypanosoma cruzi marinkellei]